MFIFKNDGIGVFVERPNRFIILAEYKNDIVICHCPNTGRMGELLIPGVKLILEKSTNPNRKTNFSVVAVYKGELVIPITSVRANNVAEKVIIPRLYKNPRIKSEITFGKSRFDFLVEDSNVFTYIEVKSCTLFMGDSALFPDAPTTRGVKHLNELVDAVDQGFSATVILVVFNPDSLIFSPNNITDPLFSSTLYKASKKVKIIPFKVGVNEHGEIFLPKCDPILPVLFKGDYVDK